MSGRPIPYRQLLAVAEHASSFNIPVPNAPGEVVQVQPVGGGRWAVARKTLFGRECLIGDAWRPAGDVADGEVSTWPLPQALMAAEAAAQVQGAEHRAWQVRHAEEIRRAEDLAARARDLAAVTEELMEPIRAAVAEGSVA